MVHAKQLDKASSVFFFLGFITSYLRYTPFVLLAAVSNMTSLCMHFLGYLFWLAACQLYPDQPGLKQHWFGFAQVKDQHKAAAIMGMVAILCGTVVFAFPIASYWFFALSSCIWLISEYHKKQNPLAYEEDYSSEQQSAYLYYAASMTGLALLSAIETTITLFFPLEALATITISSIAGICLGTFAAHYWVEYTLGDYEPDNQQEGSYNAMLSKGLVPRGEKKPSKTPDIEVKPSYLPLYSFPEKTTSLEHSDDPQDRCNPFF